MTKTLNDNETYIDDYGDEKRLAINDLSKKSIFVKPENNLKQLRKEIKEFSDKTKEFLFSISQNEFKWLISIQEPITSKMIDNQGVLSFDPSKFDEILPDHELYGVYTLVNKYRESKRNDSN